MEQRYFTANHVSDNVLKHSSSGGIFTALTDSWFEDYKKKSVVYGCISDDNLEARHYRATSPEERDKMRGSKYIQSCTAGIYKNVEDDLNNGNYVVFSGTPCQVAALKSYMSVNDTENICRLLTVEIICHGVGSKRFFDDYINHFEKKYKSRAIKCNFRAKSKPGKSEDMEIEFLNKKKYNASTTKYDWFYSAYTKNYILRPSCYNCRFAQPERTADICISDNWKEFYSENPEKHLSAVIVTSPFGYERFIKSEKYLVFSEKKLDDIFQTNLYEPSKLPDDYELFWKTYSENGYLAVQKFLGNNSFKGYVLTFVADLLCKLNLLEKVKKIKRFLAG